MKYQEIKDLHSKLEDRIKNKQKDTETNDKVLAAMAETEGWNVFSGIAQNMLAELLEHPEFSDGTPGDVRLAVYESRAFGTDVIRTLLKIVESTRIAKVIEKAEAKEEVAATE